MTLPRFDALVSYWQMHPPVHLLAAGIAGYKHEKQKPKNDLGELCTLFQQIGGEVIING